jgi:[protein-PII] uridylyltransferase
MTLSFAERRARVQALRDQCAQEFAAGIPGCIITANYCAAVERLLLEFLGEVSREGLSSDLPELQRQGCILAVGGTGRGELAPYSDVDLLLVPNRSGSEFEEFTGRFLTFLGDSGLKPGAAMRDFNEILQHARQDPQAATALVEGRLIWGDAELAKRVLVAFKSRIVDGRRRQFIEDCLAARQITGDNTIPMAQELQPDVKSSVGGLRDLHLIRWIGFARYGVADIESLRLRGALTKEDARAVRDTWEFLTRIRVNLHLHARKAQDRLTRDDQLRIAEEGGYTADPGRRPVEKFMQEYFNRTMQLAAVTRRFAAVQRPATLYSQTRQLLVGHRADRVFHVGPDRIEVARRNLSVVTGSLEGMLKLFRTAAFYGVPPAPHVLEAVTQAVPALAQTFSAESGRLFLDILKCTKPLGMVLRLMAHTGVLDKVIPDYTHIRNLLQFNQYHHFTVDEHTLRAVENCVAFEQDEGPIGAAYRSIPNKEVLHLAVLLHDIGKGFDRDHCLVGEEIGARIAERLGMPAAHREQVQFLILKHLVMADHAWRRDITDPKLLFEFSRECGSPNSLRMLYVLTAADVSAVGPGTWTSWKGNLLAEFFDRCLVILSGKHYSFHEQERFQEVKAQVAAALQQSPPALPGAQPSVPLEAGWIDRQLAGCSAYYLTCTPPTQIAADLRTIASLTPESIEVHADWDEATGTLEYRVITRNPQVIEGCFHKIAGVLAAKRLEILSADVNTTQEGVIVDSFRVRDKDFSESPPPYRISDVGDAIRAALLGQQSIQEMFRRGRKFGAGPAPALPSGLTTRVHVDHESSDTRTIIDIFTQDRSGLLYVIARTLYELNLSVDLAKIATHFDQVMDVFYVQEKDGRKVTDPDRLAQIRDTLTETLREFESAGYKDFI